MDKNYIINHVIRFVSAIVAALLIGFVIFHLTGSGESNLSTSVARRIDAGHRVTAQAYLFRDEMVLTYEGDGATYSSLEDGYRVQAGKKVSDVYSADSEQITRLRGYEEAIALLKKANGKTEGSGVQNELKSLLATQRQKLASGDCTTAAQSEAALQLLLNLRKRVNGTKTDFNEEIALLTAEKEALLRSLGTSTMSITAPFSGNFYNTADGYEQIFHSDLIKDLSAERLLQLAKSQPDEYEGSVAGVLQNSATWYAALITDDPAVTEMKVGKSYELQFENDLYTMTLYSLTPDSLTGRSLLIFRSNLTPQNGRPARSNQVSFYSESYKGLMVPTAAVRYLKAPQAQEGETPITDDTGVYVMEGNKLIFKRIRILCACDGFYVVKELSAKEPNVKSYLALNDVIVTSGKKLSEGYKN